MKKIYSSEKDVKEKIKEILKEKNIWYFMPSMNGYGRQGIPDFIGCVKGKFIAIEAKFNGNKTTLHQDRELFAIAAHEGKAFIIDEFSIDSLATNLDIVMA